MKNLKQYIDYLLLSKINREDGLELLRSDINLNREEKNIIFAFCYPRPLLDRELPSRVMAYRNTSGINKNGSLVPDIGETTLLIEAERTQQYKRFMRHLYHAFINDEVFPVSGEGENECSLCGKRLFEYDIWNRLSTGKEENIKKEFLDFGSNGSSVHLCLDCIIQLKNMVDIVENQIDKDYYISKLSKHSWNELKL